VKEKEDLLREFHRVLKPNGKLVIMVDHMSPEECEEIVARVDLFYLDSKEENLFIYQKV
jgi:ubiquinone/menaquinone biosynthesis C-methylase UbiE